jgi:sugar (pentulose or hexulose) kinase
VADRASIVLDIGKTWSKASLWTADGQPVAKRTRVNERRTFGEYLALDTEGIESWLAATLREFAATADVGHLISVSHGAGAALVREGALVLPPLDYEHPIPPAIREAYDAERDSFTATGSPALPDGLNLGAQLYYLERLQPEAFARGTQILPWAQYWGWRLSGVAAAELTSLGCHTDLWRPASNAFSQLAIARGWADLMAPLFPAGQALGVISTEWRALTGLPADLQIHCGLHDSNAALLAARGFSEIADRESTVLSTGTWFVAMRTPGEHFDLASLPAGRDCLINVDAFNRMIPSGRFMGGREIELLTGIDARRIDIKPDQPALLAAMQPVVARKTMVLPTLAPATGPYPGKQGRWVNEPQDSFERRAAVCLYAALVADTSLGLIRSKDRILIEGRFAESEAFVRALATLRPDMKIYTANAHSDVSYGALRLLNPALPPPGALTSVEPLPIELAPYKDTWLRSLA